MTFDEVIIDYNGLTGPNQPGEDQGYFAYCFGNQECYGYKPGELRPNDAFAQKIFDEIY